MRCHAHRILGGHGTMHNDAESSRECVTHFCPESRTSVILFPEALLAGPVLLMDGGMATALFKQGLGFDEPAEAWNLSRPESVRAVHEDYLAAGATCILT